MKSQPLAYNKDNQEDKEPLFDTIDTIKDCLKAYADMVPAIKPKKEVMLEAAKRMEEKLEVEMRELGDKSVELMREYGLQVHDVPLDDLVEWEERAKAAYPRLMAEAVPDALLEEVYALRDAYLKQKAEREKDR